MSKEYRFLKATPDSGAVDLSSDQRLALLAVCVANQQAHAGFGTTIDARQWSCPVCKAPGFNSGMGVIIHTCGAEYLPDDTATPCPKLGA